MKTMKKLLSSFLTIAMIMSIIPTSIFATDKSEGLSDNRAKLRMVYMGEGTGTPLNDSPSIQDSLPDTSEWGAGTIFWVGLVLSDVKTMDENSKANNQKEGTAPAAGESHFSQYANRQAYDDDSSMQYSGGISNIAAGFEYAGKYIEPVWTGRWTGNYKTVLNKVTPGAD